MAKLIASKSPVAVCTSKKSIVFSRDHSVQEGLNHIALLNSVMLNTEDMTKCGVAMMEKKTPHFNKL